MAQSLRWHGWRFAGRCCAVRVRGELPFFFLAFSFYGKSKRAHD
jgi:hypothetical protein